VAAGFRGFCPAVRRRCSLLLLGLAWLCANGAALDLVQVVAWTRMFAGYACVLPVGAALRTTFDPSKPCELCRAVAQARDSARREAPVAPVRPGEKRVLACSSPAPIIFPSPRRAWPGTGPERALARVEPVPVRPPRSDRA
jgi:hypothetical protein